MSEKIEVIVVVDDSQVKMQQAALEKKNEEIKKATEENEKRTKESFNLALGVMRSSYAIMTGMTQAMGGSMSQAFSAIYGIAVAGIQTGISIAAALAVSPVPGARLQAGLMIVSLMTAMSQLGAVSTGQAELAQQIGGLNSALHGISGMIGVMGY